MEVVFLVIGIATIGLWFYFRIKGKPRNAKLLQTFPEEWRSFLSKQVRFYIDLNDEDKGIFEKRVQLFTATKNIEGIDTEIDNNIKLMVASSAIIPTFAFSGYNYPNISTVLVYPNSFDEQFQTQRYKGHQQYISGMVGNRFMNGTVILSKPDLIKAFDGKHHKENVGVHEFVHLLDKEDGAIDGIPELLLQHRYVGPWLHEVKNEMIRIRKDKSDINPYALTNNAEFLAVVSEYFFSNPRSFENKHPKLFTFLSSIYNTDKSSI
jgi:Mlc titration factor MtfA (ptsG expression regulator)